MGIFLGKSKPGRATTARAASCEPDFINILPRKILRCGLWLGALLACTVFFSAAGAAQEERPEITPGERKVPRKKEAGPRALAVLQISSNGKASLVPVTIIVNGKFYDATAYKANPVPMALESGTVYEGERTGNSAGLFTVNSALHSNAVNVQTPWIGTGAWLPTGTEAADQPLKAETVPTGIDTSDGPPRLTKNVGAPKETAPASAPSSTPAAAPPSAPSSGDEPPRLSKPPQSGSESGQSSPASPEAKTPGDAKAGDAKTSDAKADDRAKVPASDSGADEGNRPKLRRGKPTEALPEEEIPGYSKLGASKLDASKPGAAPSDKTGKAVETTAAKGPVQLVPAISDASGPAPRSFTFEWLKNEQEERRTQMIALAKEQLRAYLDAQAKAKITPKPAGPKTAKPVARKSPEPIFENVQMIAYDLWTNNQPVLVLSAEAHMPPPAAGSPHSADSELPYSIMLVARTDMYSNLHKLYSGVTDKYHLDITPRLELVDAIDVDGDNRGELLFKETSDGGSGWVIYRASNDKLWKLFDSLNPE